MQRAHKKKVQGNKVATQKALEKATCLTAAAGGSSSRRQQGTEDAL